MEIIELPLDSIVPYARNPRFNESAVDGVAESIKQFGFQQPIVIDKDNVIVAGHTRYKAAKKLGLKTAPCVRTENLTPEQNRAYRILDNKLNETSKWNFDVLKAEIPELGVDFGAFGLSFGDINLDTPALDEKLAFKNSPTPPQAVDEKPIATVTVQTLPNEALAALREAEEVETTTPVKVQTESQPDSAATAEAKKVDGVQNENSSGETEVKEAPKQSAVLTDIQAQQLADPNFVPEALKLPSDLEQYKTKEKDELPKVDANFYMLYFKDISLAVSPTEKERFMERYEAYFEENQTSEGFVRSLLECNS